MDGTVLERLLNEIEALQVSGGMDMNELLDISDELRQVLIWMVRKHGFQVQELAEHLSMNATELEALLDAMQNKGLVEEQAETQRFQVHVKTTRLSRKYQVPKDVWKVFD